MKAKLLLKLKNNWIVDLERIIYIRADGHYLSFYMDDLTEPILVRDSLKNIMDHLPFEIFMRVHRSYIINIAFIQKLGHQSVILKNNTKVPLSRNHGLREKVKVI